MKKTIGRVLLVLTSEGKAVEKQMTMKVQQRFHKWLDIFGVEEGKSFLKTLKRFQNLIVQPELNKKTLNLIRICDRILTCLKSA